MKRNVKIGSLAICALLFLFGVVALYTSLKGGTDSVQFPKNILSVADWGNWVVVKKNQLALLGGIIGAVGAVGALAPMLAPKVASEETAINIHTSLQGVEKRLGLHVQITSTFAPLTPEVLGRAPSNLLVAEYGVVPYTDDLGRKADLLSWTLTSNVQCQGRLYVGPGGAGKTRLALEVTSELSSRGWFAGIVNRATLDSPFDVDLLFENARQRQAVGVFLALDYTDGRWDQIERIANAALEASKTLPVRIMLLTRSASFWWEEMIRDVRGVALTFAQAPVDLRHTSFSVEQARTLFHRAAEAFATRLNHPDAAPELVSKSWRTKAAPVGRMQDRGDRSPLNVAIEAYLSVLGARIETTPVSELVREEKRHWARWLGLAPLDIVRLGNRKVLMIQNCVAALTLIQGTPQRDSREKMAADLNLIITSAREKFRESASQEELDEELQVVRRCVIFLYMEAVNGHERLIPAKPDLMGERICAEALAYDPNLLQKVAKFGPREQQNAFTVANRIGSSRHDRRSRYAAIRSMLLAIESTDEADTARLLRIAALERGGLVLALSEAAPKISLKVLTSSLRNLGSATPNLIEVSRAWTREILARKLEFPDDVRGLQGIIWTQDRESEQLSVDFELNESNMALCKLATAYADAAFFVEDLTTSREWFESGYNILQTLVTDDPNVAWLMSGNRIGLATREARADRYRESHTLLVQAERDLSIFQKKNSDAYLYRYTRLLSQWIYTSIRLSPEEFESAWILSDSLLTQIRQASAVTLKNIIEPLFEFLANATNAATRRGDAMRAIQIAEIAQSATSVVDDSDLLQFRRIVPFMQQVLVNVSAAFSAVGLPDDAYDASVKAVDYARESYDFSPDANRFPLAKALDSLACDECGRGDFKKAIILEREADTLFIASPPENIAKEREDHAAALINQANNLVKMREFAEADKPLRRASLLYVLILREGTLRFPHIYKNLKDLEMQLIGHNFGGLRK